MRITYHQKYLDKTVHTTVFAKGSFVKNPGYAFLLSYLFEGFPSF